MVCLKSRGHMEHMEVVIRDKRQKHTLIIFTKSRFDSFICSYNYQDEVKPIT